MEYTQLKKNFISLKEENEILKVKIKSCENKNKTQQEIKSKNAFLVN